MILQRKKKPENTNVFNVDDIRTNDPSTIANAFNDYFTNVGTHFTEPPTCENTLFIIPTDNNDIFNIVKHLKSTKSSGHDGLSVHFLKQIIYFIATPLTHILTYLYQLVNVLTL